MDTDLTIIKPTLLSTILNTISTLIITILYVLFYSIKCKNNLLIIKEV
jgi:hypothetical protein